MINNIYSKSGDITTYYYIKLKCVYCPPILAPVRTCAWCVYCVALAADVIQAIDRSRGVIARGCSGVSAHTRASRYDACVQLYIIIYNNVCVKKATDTRTTKTIILIWLKYMRQVSKNSPGTVTIIQGSTSALKTLCSTTWSKLKHRNTIHGWF